jgi:glutamyl-Q tRNA(Asp) synthetase
MISTVSVTTRFAPSPTGRLHLGHAWSAMLARDYARERGGTFLLRIEDIDLGRCREEFVAGIIEDLEWLGLDWDGETIHQSDRFPVYAGALARLRAMGLLYPCFCTRRDIAASASAPHGREGAVYPGTCRSMDRGRREERMATERHCWRIDISAANALAGPLTWHDSVAGEIGADPLSHGDVVLARKDAPVAYHLAVTVDDAAQGMTDVVRGQDLFAATHIHRLLQALLGLPTPHYHHHRLLVDASGRRLAKRDGAPAIAKLRAEGRDPAELIAALREAKTVVGSVLP